MNIWQNAAITLKGLALQSKLIAGHTLQITRAVTGAGWVNPALLQQQTEVLDPRQTLTFHPVTYPELGKCALTLTLDNNSMATGYTAHQVGVFAMDPDEGEILYFIAGSTTNEEKDGTVVPSETESPGYGAEWTFYFQYGMADGVTVVVDPEGVVLRKEMEAYVEWYIIEVMGGAFTPITYDEIDSIFPGSGGSIGGEEGGSGGTSGVTINSITTPEIDSITDETE